MRFLLAVFLITISTVCSYAQKLAYTVDLSHTETKEVTVNMDISGIHSPTASYQMPAWAPGAYSVTNYGRFIENFKAFDSKGQELSVIHVDENRWEISNAKDLRTIRYSVVNSYKDSTSLYFALCHIDTNFFFANGTALFGYLNDRKDIPAEIEFIGGLPLSYPLEHRIPSNLGIKYLAMTYDELADAPVMAGKDLQFRWFDQGGAKYEIALASDEPFAMDSLVEATKKIVKSQTDFFGDTPFKRYAFLINAPTFSHLPVQGLGALEHANSSAYLLFNAPWSAFKENGYPILSHEFFHTWNVKRIHSDKLGPFDYTKRVMTTSLWLSEGITDYYANTLLSRTGIFEPGIFERKIAEWIGGMNYSHAAATESLEQLSIDESAFDLEKALTFYTKGPLVGMMLDIEIRTKTNDSKSLDDVMHKLYAESKKGIHFKDEELIGKIEKFSGVDLHDFYRRYIAGTDSLPLSSYLSGIGLIKDYKKTIETGVSLKTRFNPNEDLPVIDSFYEQSELEAAGLMIGDTILSFQGGKPASTLNLDEFSLNNTAPQKLAVTIGRKGKRFEKTITLTQSRSSHVERKTIAPNENATPMEAKLRREIYGG